MSGKKDGTGEEQDRCVKTCTVSADAKDKDAVRRRAAWPFLSPKLFVFQGGRVFQILSIC